MRRVKSGLSLSATASLLMACGVTPSREKISSDVGKAVETQTPAVPVSWGTPAISADVRVAWIESFNDPTLVKLVEEAQANNKNLATPSSFARLNASR